MKLYHIGFMVAMVVFCAATFGSLMLDLTYYNSDLDISYFSNVTNETVGFQSWGNRTYFSGEQVDLISTQNEEDQSRKTQSVMSEMGDVIQSGKSILTTSLSRLNVPPIVLTLLMVMIGLYLTYKVVLWWFDRG